VVDDDSQIMPGITEYSQLLMMRHNQRDYPHVIRGAASSKRASIGVIDGDLQHPPHLLLQLLVLLRGTDLAVASHMES